ncbi:hypothetical protein AU381_23490 [Sinorhizobium glycinis]|uniref:Uncharacterized protein n=1 Tax=Sinorhizobium glycinis TaxID=1472378 RepID=A0A178XUQ9_9HYPH|nr:hypothetical protein AU381_23490 [Sinorhizobium glycinis]
MSQANSVYTLNFESISQLKATSGLQTSTYTGTLLASGLDASFEILHGKIRFFLDGVEDSPDGAFGGQIRRYERAIMNAVSVRSSTHRSVICGKWHVPGRDYSPLFIPYVTREFLPSGEVASRRYSLEIFDYDELDNGGTIGCTLHDCSEIYRPLHVVAKNTLNRAEEYLLAGEACPIEGVIWYPDTATADLPIVVSRPSSWR